MQTSLTGRLRRIIRPRIGLLWIIGIFLALALLLGLLLGACLRYWSAQYERRASTAQGTCVSFQSDKGHSSLLNLKPPTELLLTEGAEGTAVTLHLYAVSAASAVTIAHVIGCDYRQPLTQVTVTDTFFVAVTTNAAIELVDKGGHSSSWLVRRSATMTEAASSTQYIRHTGQSGSGGQGEITVSALSSIGAPAQKLIVTEVPLEGKWSAFQRYVAAGIVSNAIAVTLATLAIVPTVITAWYENRAKKLDEEEQEIVQKIQGLPILVQEDVDNFLDKYGDIQGAIKKTFGHWLDRYKREHLHLVLDNLWEAENWRTKTVYSSEDVRQLRLVTDFWHKTTKDSIPVEALLWFLLECNPGPTNQNKAYGALNPYARQRFHEEDAARLWRSYLQVWPHLTFWRKSVNPHLVIVRYSTSEPGTISLYTDYTDYWRFRKAEHNSFLVEELKGTLEPNSEQLRHRVIAGAARAGKSRRALQRAHQLIRSITSLETTNEIQANSTLPIYWPCYVYSTNPEEYLRSLAAAMARTLLAILSVQPRRFVSTSGNGAAMAHLLTEYWGHEDTLRRAFREFRAGANFKSLYVCQQIDAISPISVLESRNSPMTEVEGLLHVIANAFPHGLAQRVILLDLQPLEQTVTRSKTKVLQDVLYHLHQLGFIVHLFARPELIDSGMGNWLAPREDIIHDHDEQSLRNILRTRLAAAVKDPQMDSRNADIGRLFEETTQNIEEIMIRYSRGSPGRLLEMFGFLISKLEQRSTRDGLLDETDLAALKAKFGGENLS